MPRSVNTVSNVSVSVENARTSDEDVVKSSVMQELTASPSAAIIDHRKIRAFAIYEKRPCIRIIVCPKRSGHTMTCKVHGTDQDVFSENLDK